jgi:hypothetical protein
MEARSATPPPAPTPLANRPRPWQIAAMRTLTLALCLLASPAAAADIPVSPEQFEARVLGQTLSYSTGGAEYGAEEYLNNRRVRWSFLDGTCQEGEWYASGEQICFVYEDVPNPQCWQFYMRNGRLMARFENDPMATELYETSRRDEPLLCPGPKVGV